MIARGIFAVAVFCFSPAFAQSFVGQPLVGSPGGFTRVDPSFFAATPPISVTAVAPFSAGSSACGGFSTACYSTVQIPLSEFATAASVARSQAQVVRGVAMATSLALEAPLDGKGNRLAIGTGAFENSNAVSVNYSHRAGAYDMGIAASFAGGSALGKASLGFSW